MNEKIANKIMGCFFILISVLLYITEQISVKLLLLVAPNLAIKVDNVFTLALSILFLILGVVFILRKK